MVGTAAPDAAGDGLPAASVGAAGPARAIETAKAPPDKATTAAGKAKRGKVCIERGLELGLKLGIGRGIGLDMK
jgi:hypothetical protein